MADTLSCTPLRVGHVVLSLEPGGAETLVIDLVRRMAVSAVVRVYCLDRAGSGANEIRASGIGLDVLGRRPGFDLRVARRLRDAARTHRLDVLHCHQYSPFVYGCIAALPGSGPRVVFTEHGRLSDGSASRKRRAANRLLSRLPEAIFAVSENLRRFMISEGFPEHRVGVIHNGIEAGPAPTPADRCRARAMLGISDAAFLVGTAARLDPVKDLGCLLRAFARLRNTVPDAHLVLAGEGEERGTLEGIAVRSGIGDAVHLLGHRTDVRTLLPGFDVYANSSISEGISVTILEAMAAGLPVVATRVGGTPEVVIDGLTGLLAPARDAEALSDKLVRLAADGNQRAALGGAGRTRVTGQFTADRMTQGYLEAYGAAAHRAH